MAPELASGKRPPSPFCPPLVKEVERKVALLQRAFPSKTIQRVLVVHGEVSRDLVQTGYFYRIIRSHEFLAGSHPA